MLRRKPFIIAIIKNTSNHFILIYIYNTTLCLIVGFNYHVYRLVTIPTASVVKGVDILWCCKAKCHKYTDKTLPDEIYMAYIQYNWHSCKTNFWRGWGVKRPPPPSPGSSSDNYQAIMFTKLSIMLLSIPHSSPLLILLLQYWTCSFLQVADWNTGLVVAEPGANLRGFWYFQSLLIQKCSISYLQGKTSTFTAVQ